MSLPVRLLPEARLEFDAAADWYGEQSASVGCDFIAQVRAVIQRIASNPQLYPVVHNEARKAVLRRFPYVIIYREDLHEVLILAVLHAARDPAVWRGRT